MFAGSSVKPMGSFTLLQGEETHIAMAAFVFVAWLFVLSKPSKLQQPNIEFCRDGCAMCR
jgi:hypothetical protein